MDTNNLKALDNIEVEDLEYVERDLDFSELASVAILLYGEERTTAEFALQKLLIISNARNASQESSNAPEVPRDLLRTYALKVNQNNWRACIIEALCVINARRVLRKLGFKWETVRMHYLPHITELALHLHPLLKALYKICDNLTPAQAGRLRVYMDQYHPRPPHDHFRFYDTEVLEVFMLDWITRRIIDVGDHEAKEAYLQVLFEYFKLNELEDMKTILINTLMHSTDRNVQDSNISKEKTSAQAISNVHPTFKEPSISPQVSLNGNAQHQVETDDETPECYKVDYESAGFVLIINQREFYSETDVQLQHLLPAAPLKIRKGTDIDKDKLLETFTLYGYKPIVKENLKHTDILNIIGDYAKRSILWDSFIVCILSHGVEGHVYGSNSIPVGIAEIEDKLTAEELVGKPKALIIQACQNNEDEKDGDKTEATEERTKKSTDRRKKECAKHYADILKAMATVPGFYSLRHTQEGSWFIQSLCSAIIRLSHKKHLLDIITAVIREVSNLKGKSKEVMLPQFSSTLMFEFKLPARKTN